MASDSFKTILFALILFSLFSWLMLFGITGMISNYGKDTDEVGNGILNDEDYYDSIEDVRTSTDSYRQRFEEGTVDDTDDASGIFGIVTDTISLISTPFTLLGSLARSYNVPSLVISIGLGILSLSLIFGIWALIKKGD